MSFEVSFTGRETGLREGKSFARGHVLVCLWKQTQSLSCTLASVMLAGCKPLPASEPRYILQRLQVNELSVGISEVMVKQPWPPWPP